MHTRERLGRFLGRLASPLFATVAQARHGRVFHPEGIVLTASVEPLYGVTDAQLRALGQRLTGPALVRFSTALWRGGREWPDALGCAIRFRRAQRVSVEPVAGDQDLLFATIRTPVATPLAPLWTRVHDFFANRYYAVGPFDVPGFGRARWRLVTDGVERALHAEGQGQDRASRLRDRVDAGHGALRLELRPAGRRDYVGVARVNLLEIVEVDQDRLRFSPFRAGRGIVPRGFVHALRRGAYAASQEVGHPDARREPPAPDYPRRAVSAEMHHA